MRVLHEAQVRGDANQRDGGGVFVIESQFSRDASASKVGFTTLNYHLAQWGFAFADNKRMTDPARDFGFVDVPRAEYLKRLAEAVKLPGKPGRWQVEADPVAVAAWQPKSPEKNAA